MRDQEAVLVAIITVKRDPLAVRRPHGTVGGLVTTEENALPGAQIHHPELVIRTAGTIAHRDRVSDGVPVGRERYVANGAEARKVAAVEALSVGGRSDNRWKRCTDQTNANAEQRGVRAVTHGIPSK
jgi:hypothetical protein